MQNILINLNIISKIKPNDKIYINSENFISIETDSAFQGILRFLYNNSRNKNINNLNNFYSGTYESIDDLINSKYLNIFISKLDFRKSKDNLLDHSYPLEHQCDLENENFIQIYNSLLEYKHYMTLSIHGLNNLKQTYSSDIVTISKIDIIIGTVELYIKKINKKIENIDNIKKKLMEYHQS